MMQASISEAGSTSAPALSIRRFPADRLDAHDLLARQTLTQPMLDFLQAAIACRLNVMISGGTGAGKTTMLNVLSSFIGERELIITIEDAAELVLRQRHVVRLETRPPNIEGKGAIRQRQLVINALRMRPDRVVLGELRGAEAFNLLHAMNTGQDGTMVTLHASGTEEVVSRLLNMILMGVEALPRGGRLQVRVSTLGKDLGAHLVYGLGTAAALRVLP